MKDRVYLALGAAGVVTSFALFAAAFVVHAHATALALSSCVVAAATACLYPLHRRLEDWEGRVSPDAERALATPL